MITLVPDGSLCSLNRSRTLILYLLLNPLEKFSRRSRVKVIPTDFLFKVFLLLISSAAFLPTPLSVIVMVTYLLLFFSTSRLTFLFSFFDDNPCHNAFSRNGLQHHRRDPNTFRIDICRYINLKINLI